MCQKECVSVGRDWNVYEISPFPSPSSLLCPSSSFPPFSPSPLRPFSPLSLLLPSSSPLSNPNSLTDEFQVQVLSNTCADQLQLQGKYILKVTTSELALTCANGELPTRYTLCSQLVP